MKQKTIKMQQVEQADDHIKFDYTLETPEERTELINTIIENTPSEKLTKKYLEAMADYILLACKPEIKEHKILTKNRWNGTIKEREVSLEGLSVSFEDRFNEGGNSSGQDYVYNLIIENDKNVILSPKVEITEEDIKEIPDLKKITDEIHRLENEVMPRAVGKQKYVTKQNIIQLYKDRFVIKAGYKKHINCINSIKSANKIELYENIILNKDGDLIVDANLSFLIPKHVSAILCNYSRLKESGYSKFSSDIYYTMLAFDEVADEALKPYPLYEDLVIYKVDGLQNADIQKRIEEKYGIKYSVEYISSLWRNKIPKLIAETAEKRWLNWHFTEEEKGQWKKCSKCGQIKLAHNKFFSKNKSSKDGYYSICKDCRNKKKGIEYNK